MILMFDFLLITGCPNQTCICLWHGANQARWAGKCHCA